MIEFYLDIDGVEWLHSKAQVEITGVPARESRRQEFPLRACPEFHVLLPRRRDAIEVSVGAPEFAFDSTTNPPLLPVLWTMAAPLYTTDSGQLFHAGKIIIICVGLPGSSPSLIPITAD